MDILVSLARGASKILLFFIFFASSCRTKSVVYYDASKTVITTKRGITLNGDAPLTGVLFRLSDDLDTLEWHSYQDGKLHGMSKTRYPNGNVKAIRYYENGWKQGQHRGWHENGRPAFVFHFVDDMFEGNQVEWMPTGQLYSDLNYRKGQEYGHQRVWYGDGKIKTNYIIKNNRRYGLLGTKNCVNAADSVVNKL